MNAFSTIPKNPALDNCLSNIGISDTIINFNQICYLIKNKWINWDKTQDEIDKTKIGIA